LSGSLCRDRTVSEGEVVRKILATDPVICAWIFCDVAMFWNPPGLLDCSSWFLCLSPRIMLYQGCPCQSHGRRAFCSGAHWMWCQKSKGPNEESQGLWPISGDRKRRISAIFQQQNHGRDHLGSSAGSPEGSQRGPSVALAIAQWLLASPVFQVLRLHEHLEELSATGRAGMEVLHRKVA